MFFYRLKGSGFIQSLSNVQPDFRVAAAVAADGMASRFSLAFGHDMRCRGDRLLFFQGTSDNHLSLVAAVLAFTYLFEFLFRHEISS